MNNVTLHKPTLPEYRNMNPDEAHIESAHRGHLIELDSLEWDLNTIAELTEQKRTGHKQDNFDDECRYVISSIGMHYAYSQFKMLLPQEQALMMRRIREFGIFTIKAAPVAEVVKAVMHRDAASGLPVDSLKVYRPHTLAGQLGNFEYIKIVLPDMIHAIPSAFIAFEVPTETDPLGLLSSMTFSLHVSRTATTEMRTTYTSVEMANVAVSMHSLYQRPRDYATDYIDCTLSTDTDVLHTVSFEKVGRSTRHNSVRLHSVNT